MMKTTMQSMKTNPAPSGSNIENLEEKLKAIEEKNSIASSGKYNHEQLMNALYAMWDAFDRSLITFFLVGKTAEACSKNLGLAGDKVEIGLRRSEYESGSWRIFTEFMKPVSETHEFLVFQHEGVPITCRLFDDDTYFDYPAPYYWQYESFNLPNPYKDYVEKYETKPTA